MTPDGVKDDVGGILQKPWMPLLAAGVLVAATAARVASAWDSLPERMASHFGPGGAPDGFMPRSEFVSVMALVGGGTVLVLTILPQLLRFIPTELINMPNRDYWLAPERRARSLARLGGWMAWFGVLTGALIAVVVELTIRANEAHTGLDMGSFTTLMVVYAVGVAVVLFMLVRQFRVPRSA
jgi:serine/threonine-protein kinase